MQIIDSMNFGGAEVLLRDLARGLLTRGYRVSVRYITHGPIAEELESMGIPTVRLPKLALVDPVLIWRMLAEILQEKPDIVHTHLFKSDIHGRVAARMTGKPVVISTLHNCHNWAKNPILGNIYGITSRLADQIVAVSEEVRDYAVRYAHIDPKRVTTIPNAIPLDRFEDTQPSGAIIRQEFNIPGDAPLIGIIARLTEQKDHETFLRAAARILEHIPETRFMIVGDGPLRSSLEKLALSLGIRNSVVFGGVRKDIPSILSALDILVFSSRWEGLPVALLEGMASHLPVVATAVGSIPAVLDNEVTGTLVSPANSDEIAQACIRLIKDPSLRQQMGRAGYTKILENYSLDSMIDKTDCLYQTLLKRHDHKQ
jgi:glycosyltransferase involved in cell wall biosynthesis